MDPVPHRIVLVGTSSRRSAELPVRSTLLAALCLTVFVLVPTGAGALLGASHQRETMRQALHLARLSRAHDGAANPGRRTPYLLAALSTPAPAPPTTALAPATVPQTVLARPMATPEARRGHLRIYSLHHDEYVDVVPYDARGKRNEAAFAALAHVFRCRVTGHEVEISERLVRLLTTINDLYDRPLHLISGHRVAHTIHTSPTSQHTRGTAADVRVPGVPITELREVARKLGARGLGLYTHKRFVHIDFRDRRRYFWSDEAQPTAPATVEHGTHTPPPAPGHVTVAAAAHLDG